MNRTFVKKRETKNKVVFEEVTGDGTDEAVGTLYITKGACEELGNPEGVSIEITPHQEN